MVNRAREITNSGETHGRDADPMMRLIQEESGGPGGTEEDDLDQ